MGDWTDFDFSTVTNEYNILAMQLAIKNQAIGGLRKIHENFKESVPVYYNVHLGPNTAETRRIMEEFRDPGTQRLIMKRVRNDLVQANKSLDGRLEVRGPELYFVIPK